MSKITDDDVDAMVAVCGEWRSWRGGMRAAAEEIERRVLARVKAESKPMHEPVNDDEAMAMINDIHYGTADSFFERVRSAGNWLLAKRAGLDPKPMNEPVTNAEIDDFMRAISDPYEGNMTPREVTGIALDNFLARRAATTRPEVVVTEEMRQACAKAFGWEGGAMSDVIWHAMNWMAKHLNGKPDKPVDPRVVAVLSWANNTLGAQNILDEDIASLLAKLDEVKP